MSRSRFGYVHYFTIRTHHKQEPIENLTDEMQDSATFGARRLTCVICEFTSRSMLVDESDRELHTLPSPRNIHATVTSVQQADGCLQCTGSLHPVALMQRRVQSALLLIRGDENMSIVHLCHRSIEPDRFPFQSCQ